MKVAIKEILREATFKLREVTDIPQKEAMLLLCEVLKQEMSWLVTHDNDEVEIEEHFFSFIERRASHEPLEYIFNRANFYGKEFFVDKRVLIPRPETELLVDKTLELIRDIENPYIVEIGCGSGIISIMLALELPNARITAVDISEDALHVARINAEKFGVQEKINFVLGSYLGNLESKIDMIISNPPYIANAEVLDIGLSYEPSLALYGGHKGDEMLRHIIDLYIDKKVKILACEMGYDQKESISKYAYQKNLEASFYKDLAGLDRGFWIKETL